MDPGAVEDEHESFWGFPAVFVFINLKLIVKVDDLLNGDPNLFGGLDISFIEGDSVNACACYVVIDRDFKVGLYYWIGCFTLQVSVQKS